MVLAAESDPKSDIPEVPKQYCLRGQTSLINASPTSDRARDLGLVIIPGYSHSICPIVVTLKAINLIVWGVLSFVVRIGEIAAPVSSALEILPIANVTQPRTS